MAGGCCLAELGVCDDESLSMNENGSLLNAEFIAGDGSDSLKSGYYLSNELCSDYLSNGVRELDVVTSGLLNEVCSVMGTEHVDFNDDFKRMCAESEDNCRKKRCTDRYDSSESSDRFVFCYDFDIFECITYLRHKETEVLCCLAGPFF